MVRTLANAIARGRLAHAFLMTGVCGVGKTSTARLIAKALNCTGPDGKGGIVSDTLYAETVENAWKTADATLAGTAERVVS